MLDWSPTGNQVLARADGSRASGPLGSGSDSDTYVCEEHLGLPWQ